MVMDNLMLLWFQRCSWSVKQKLLINSAAADDVNNAEDNENAVATDDDKDGDDKDDDDRDDEDGEDSEGKNNEVEDADSRSD